MNTHRIIEELEAERDRLESALAALQGSHKARGKKKRHMSAAARKRISEAQKRRWAKARK